MLGLVFNGTKVAPEGGTDEKNTFYFDDWHKNTQKGNSVVTQSEIEEFITSKTDPPAIAMANFSTTEKYNIEIENNTTADKTITYMTGGHSGLFFSYNVTIDKSVVSKSEANIRCVVPWTINENGVGRCLFYEMFSFVVPSGKTAHLEYETAIPNVGSAGIYNVLYAR